MTKVIGGNITPKQHAKLKVEDVADRVLDRLIFAKSAYDGEKGIISDGVFTPYDMGPLWFMGHEFGKDFLFNAPEEINAFDIVWPMSFGAVFETRNDEWGRHLQCNYYETVPAKKLRGSHRFVGRKNVAWFNGYLTDDLKFHSSVNYAAWSGHSWRSIQRIKYNQDIIAAVPNSGSAPIQKYDATGENDIGKRVALGQSMALTCRYEWGAQFSLGNSPKIIIPTTPRGILELFNDRDKPEDKNRRDALKHWVKHHTRKTKTYNFTHVQAHLRGATKFNWRGFDVEIRPSQYDIEKGIWKK